MGQYDPCSACGEDAVEFDCVEVVVACKSCGRMISGADQELVHSAHTDATTFVEAKDSGTKAGSYLLHQNILAKSMRSSIQPIEDLTRRLNAAADHMHLPPTISSTTIRAQAKDLLDSHGSNITTRYGKDATAYAALYAAIRLNKLPYTLLDVSMATRLNVFEIGKAYRALLQHSSLVVATLSPSDLFKRTITNILSLANDEGEARDKNNNTKKNKKRKNSIITAVVSSSEERRLEEDASMVVDWAQDNNVPGWTGSPMPIAVSATLFAAEMNQMAVPLKKVCQELRVDHLNVSRRLKKLRDRLEVLGKLLPYAKTTKVTGKNIALHARIVIKLPVVTPGALVEEGLAARGDGWKTSRQVKKKKKKKESQQAADTKGERSTTSKSKKDRESVSDNDDDIEDEDEDDADVDEYLRTDEEVEVYSEVLEVLEHLEQKGARR